MAGLAFSFQETAMEFLLGAALGAIAGCILTVVIGYFWLLSFGN